MMDAVIVGGGIAGLASAWDLRNRDILVLEASDRLGGRIRSETREAYWLNLGAHVFSGPGSASWRRWS
jgi:oxygen-dependent protoporphyrinogen oxidase